MPIYSKTAKRDWSMFRLIVIIFEGVMEEGGQRGGGGHERGRGDERYG